MEKIIKASTKKVRVPVDMDIIEFIQASDQYREFLAGVLPQNEIKSRADEGGNHFIDVAENSEQPFIEFYTRFEKVAISVEADHFQNFGEDLEKEVNHLQSSVTGCVSKIRKGKIVVAGEKQSVKAFNDKMQQRLQELKKGFIMKQEQKEFFPAPPDKIQLLDKSSCLDEIRKQYKVQVEVQNDKLLIIGQESQIEKAKLFLLMSMMNACSRTFKTSKGNCDLLQTEGGIEKAYGILKNRNVNAVITAVPARDEVSVTALSAEQVDLAVSCLQKAMYDKSIPLTEGTSEVLQSEKGETFLKRLEYHHNVLVRYGSGSCLVIVGIEINEAEEELLDFLDKNAIHKRFLAIKMGLIRFIFENCKDQLEEIESSLRNQLVTIAQSDGAVLITGSTSGLKEAVKRLEAVSGRAVRDKVVFQRSGVRKLFQKGFIKDVLRGLQNELSLVIISEAEDIAAHIENTPPIKNMVQSKNSKNRLVCSFKTREGRSLFVYQGDLTKHNVDVLVNPANSRLLLGGGVAGAILEAGGKTIQNECDKYIRTNGELADGEAVVTGAGKMKCEAIIHAVGPKWQEAASYIGQRELQSKQETAKETLKLAIINALDAGQQFRSMAIPAVSSGIFGFPNDLCAKILVSTALEFCQENPSCNLQEIHFVNIDTPTVKAFEQEFEKNFKSKSGYKVESAAVDTGYSKREWWKEELEDKKRLDNPFGKSRAPTRARGATEKKKHVSLPPDYNDDVNTLSTPERVEINLVVGDLANQKVMFTDFFSFFNLIPIP